MENTNCYKDPLINNNNNSYWNIHKIFALVLIVCIFNNILNINIE